MNKAPQDAIKIVSENRKARFNYQIIETFEVGIVLSGAEVKSIRGGGLSLQESYVRPYKGEVFLLGAHIKEYKFTTDSKYNPTQQRKLLLHKKEIEKLIGKVEQKGLTLVPLKAYLKNGRVKLEIALGKGKDSVDKRQDIKQKETKREIQRALKRGDIK